MSDLLKAAEQACTLAQRLGADQCAVAISRSRGVDLEWRDGALEQVKERTKQTLSAELYVDGRYSSSSTSDLRPDAIESFLAGAIDMAKFLEPDPHRGLPDPERYTGRAEVDLDLADESVGTMESADRRHLVAQLESMVRAEASDLNIVSVSTTLSDGVSRSARVHSNGFVGERKSSILFVGHADSWMKPVGAPWAGSIRIVGTGRTWILRVDCSASSISSTQPIRGGSSRRESTPSWSTDNRSRDS